MVPEQPRVFSSSMKNAPTFTGASSKTASLSPPRKKKSKEKKPNWSYQVTCTME